MEKTLNTLMARLRLKQLQLLIALDDHKSLHKAAGVMAMTQSAASKVLHELEDMVGVALFERSKTGMIPNQYGHSLIRHARLMVTGVGALCQDIADIRSGKGGRLAIGSIMGAVPDVIAPILNWLHSRQPALTIEVVEDTSKRLLALLEDGKIDLMIGRIAGMDDQGKFRYQPLCDEPVSVVVGHGHPPLRKKELTLRDLKDHRWVVYPSRMPLHTLLEREFDRAGLSMPANHIATASSLVTITLLERSMDAAALLPTEVATFFEKHRIVRILPIQLHSKQQTFGIVTRSGGTLSPPAEQFIQLLRDRNMVH
ncbi:LysR family transcriptional regulator [Noviherbaspirillum galbum]|uniref:LysR family transcriptional regulator n=1 Tax=Noviherbaspirillum galbum TaxID=2709383 RepID=A0A6B3SKC9_9BURK|nr:LysR family transcriptional regulator [Noviherbaspirillum galbum]NEX61261.1 LysR family transcriptional regulator [Noviherbaspirillum galbum]